MDLDSLILNAKAQQAETKPVDQDVMLGDRVVTVRIFPVDGPKWTEFTTAHPPRPGQLRDAQFGYNANGILRNYGDHIAFVDGDEIDRLKRTDDDGREYSKWPELHDMMSGPDLTNLAVALWGKNDYEHQVKLVEAGKALTGASKKR